MTRWMVVPLSLGLGCSGHKPPMAPQVVVVHDPQPAPPASPLVGVLDGVGMTLLLPRERQIQEIQLLTDSLGRADIASDRIQLAMLLAMGDPSVRDAERARKLLEGRAWDDAAYEMLSRLVFDLLDERADHANDKIQAQEALDSERRLRRSLQARLEAMRAIDTEIDARELGVEGQDASQAEDPVR